MGTVRTPHADGLAGLAAPGILDGLVVDRTSPIPLYFQVAQHLEQAIAGGGLPPGARLDNEVQLASMLGLSRPTMRQAIQHLVDKGLLVRRRGVGTHVVQSKVRRPLQLTSLHDDLAGADQAPRTKVLRLSTGRATAEQADLLEVTSADDVVTLVRLRFAEGQPIARMTNFLPADLLDESLLTTSALEAGGLYQLLRSAGIGLHSAGQVIGARTASTEEAAELDEEPGAALLTVERVTRGDRGRVIEVGQHVYAASRYSVELTLSGV